MERISLGNAVFEGENNAYLLGTEDGATTTLVDTGIATDAVRRDLQQGLADHELDFSDVDTVFLTHWHHDHAALTGEIQRAGDATVYVHEADASLVEQNADALAELEETQRSLFDDWGMPRDAQDELTAYLKESEPLHGDPPTVEPITDGDTFDLGTVELEAIHMPGHAAGLTGYAFDGKRGREIFAGDVLLPKYTPNVGGADVRVDAPLEKYLQALRSLMDAEYERAWPGHRDPIDNPAARADVIIEHHRERTERVLGVVREQGPVDAWTVSAELFGGLSEIHILHGPGEAYAHLDHLTRAGVLSVTEAGYELVDETVTASDALDV